MSSCAPFTTDGITLGGASGRKKLPYGVANAISHLKTKKKASTHHLALAQRDAPAFACQRHAWSNG